MSEHGIMILVQIGALENCVELNNENGGINIDEITNHILFGGGSARRENGCLISKMEMIKLQLEINITLRSDRMWARTELSRSMCESCHVEYFNIPMSQN